MPLHPLKTVEELLDLLDCLPASVALWDEHVRLRYGNRRSLVRFGRPPEHLLGARLSDLVQAHAVELSAPYIDGALAGRIEQVERAMVDRDGQRYNAHQVTHIPNIVDGVVRGYCAMPVDITASIEGYEQARRAREQAALQAERARIAGDIGRNPAVDELTDALERLDAALSRASGLVPSLSTAADAIDHAIEELRGTLPGRLLYPDEPEPAPLAPFPEASPVVDPVAEGLPGVHWPPDIFGRGWGLDDVIALLDLLPAAIAAWDGNLRNVFANRAAVRWFGCPDRESALGQSAQGLLGPQLYEAASVAYTEAALRGEPKQFDRTVAHTTGLRHLQVYCAPRMQGERVGGLYTFVVDVTARVEAELALQDARAELACARERERIADGLHNLVIQRLFATGLTATLTRPDAADEAVQQQVQSVQDGIVQALDDLEAAVTTLHADAELLDLLPDLACLVHGIADPRGLAVRIETVGSVEFLPPAIGAEILAAAEAIVDRAAQSPKVTEVSVTLAADSAGAWLRVVDDGGSSRGGSSYDSLEGVAAKAARLGGGCTWRRARPRGTVVDWRIPFG